MNPQISIKERMEATLQKLQVLKNRISELKEHCEELQKVYLEYESSILRCDECGNPVEPEQEIQAKNFGVETRHYHKECFRKLWMHA